MHGQTTPKGTEVFIQLLFLILSKSGMCHEIRKSRVSNLIKIHIVVTEFLYMYRQN